MSGGLFSRLKTWIFQEDVASVDLNNEFNNIIEHLIPEYIEGMEQTVTQMQQTENPGGVGTENLGTSLQDDVEQLRFVIQRILGSDAPQWYSAPDTTLSQVASALSGLNISPFNTVISGAVSSTGQPMYLIPSGTTNSVTLKCTATPIEVVINGTDYTFSSDITLTGLSRAPSSGNTGTIGTDAMLNTITSNKTFGEPFVGLLDSTSLQYQEYILLGSPGGNVVSASGRLNAFHSGSEYFIGVLQSSGTKIWSCLRGFFFNSSGANIPRAGLSTSGTVALNSLGWIFLRSNGTLSATYNQPSVSGTAPTSPLSGDYWYNTTLNQWNIYSGVWTVDNSVFVGMVCTDTSITQGARSADFYGVYQSQNSLVLCHDTDDTAVIRPYSFGSRCSVYGKSLYIEGNYKKWDIVANLVSGVTLTNGLNLFLYMDNLGNPYVDSVVPHTRDDLQGYYHPANPWRCFGCCTTDGTNFTQTLKSYSTFPFQGTRSIGYFNYNGSSAETSYTVTGTGVFGPVISFVGRGKPFMLVLDGLNAASAGSAVQLNTSGSGGGGINLAAKIISAGVTSTVNLQQYYVAAPSFGIVFPASVLAIIDPTTATQTGSLYSGGELTIQLDVLQYSANLTSGTIYGVLRIVELP